MPAFGRSRNVRIGDLRAGMRLTEPIRGVRGKILVNSGEILSQKHVDQIRKWDSRPGQGRLSLYTRTVWVKTALGSERERPECDSDPYAAFSVQNLYKKPGMSR